MDEAQQLTAHFNIPLVVLSVIVGVFASYASLFLLTRYRAGRVRNRFVFLLSSSFVVGAGMWSMHFIGMLAYHLDATVTYDLGLLSFSFLFGVACATLSFWFIHANRRKKAALFLSSGAMAAGIGGMHYLAMEAMVANAKMSYAPLPFAGSIAVAIIMSFIVFRVLLHPRSEGKHRSTLIASILLGLSISLTHYTGMKAIRFHAHPQHLPGDSAPYVISNGVIASIIGSFVCLILLTLVIAAMQDERFTRKLQESEQRYRQLVELAPIAIAIHHFGAIRYVNPACVTILGAETAGEVVGKHMLDFIHPDYHSVVKARWQAMSESGAPAQWLEERIRQIGGQEIEVEIMGIPIVRDGERLFQIFFRDITDRKRAEQLMHRLAFHDPLTGLPNRRLFIARLNQALEDTTLKPAALAVMFIDLDGFKQVNDTMGHDAGDAVLHIVARRLEECVGEGAMAAQLAGDEFTVLLEETTADDVIRVAQAMLQTLSMPIDLKGGVVALTPSIGISFRADASVDAETRIKQADIAMYRAKANGKNNYQFYS